MIPEGEKNTACSSRRDRRTSPETLPGTSERNLPKRAIGKYIHELFEKIEWLESDSQINAIAEEWKKSCRENGVFKNDLLRQFHSSMSDKDIKAIFIKPEKENVEVWRERSFAMIMDEKFVSGIFDRVMIWRDGNGKPIKAVIVDYKSSVVDTAEQVERKKEHYRSQMELYNKALLKILGNDDLPVALKLIFTRARSVVVL